MLPTRIVTNPCVKPCFFCPSPQGNQPANPRGRADLLTPYAGEWVHPSRSVRRQVRELIDSLGGFIEVYIAAPVEVCEQRDRKGLYAQARAGIIKGFTGIDDPYEEPENAEIVLDTTTMSPEESAAQVLLYLENEGFIAPEAD